MTTPTIHLNGTSGESLAAGYAAAWDACQAAFDALKQAAPNGRDYYPQGERAFEAATAEHRARLQRIQDVMDELEKLIRHCEKG